MTVQLAEIARPEGADGDAAHELRIAGRSLRHLAADTLSGRWDYERNFLAMLAPAPPPAALAELASAMFIGLTAAAPPDDRDLVAVRLAATTRAPFETAVLPLFQLAGPIAATGQALADGRLAPPGLRPPPGLREVAPRLLARLVAAWPLGRYVRVLQNRAHRPDTGEVVAAYLLECGLTPEQLPYAAMAARLPLACAAYTAERLQRANRYVGLEEDAGWSRDDGLEQRVAGLIDDGVDFATAMMALALDRRVDRADAQAINTALVCGAEYGDTAASSIMTALVAQDGARATDIVQAVVATFGYYHLGALKESARLIAAAAEGAPPIDSLIARFGVRDLDGRLTLPGFGHRFQRRDPRAVVLLEMCRQRFAGRYIEAAARLDDELGARRLGFLNMDGIGGAMGLQAGFPVEASPVLTLIARLPGIAKAAAQAARSGAGVRLRVRQGLR